MSIRFELVHVSALLHWMCCQKLNEKWATKSRGLLGDNRRDENPLSGTFWTTLLRNGWRWVKVAYGSLKWLGSKWPKVAYSVLIRTSVEILTLFLQRTSATIRERKRGKLFYLQLELFCLQLSVFAYSPLRRLLDALSHCKQKSSKCK